MHDTDVRLSDDDRRFYPGYPGDLRQRLREHRRGHVRWTASGQPVQLVDDAACRSREEALGRERFWKSGKGKRSWRSRRVAFLSSVSRNKLERH